MVVGRAKRERERHAEQLLDRVARVVAENDIVAARRLSMQITELWQDTWSGELYKRLDDANRELLTLLRETAKERVRRATRPCSCGASELCLSEEVQIGEVIRCGDVRRGPRFRLLYCPSCDRTEWLASFVEELPSQPPFTEKVRPDIDEPCPSG